MQFQPLYIIPHPSVNKNWNYNPKTLGQSGSKLAFFAPSLQIGAKFISTSLTLTFDVWPLPYARALPFV